MNAALQAQYNDLGWSLIPIPAYSKAPDTKEWGTRQFAPAEFRANSNYGLVLGPRSHGAVDVDLDCPEAVALAPLYLPHTDARFGRPSNPGSHWIYESAGAQFAFWSEPLKDDRKNALLELRAPGEGGAAHQTIIPPSVADGEAREWEVEAI